MRRPCCFVVTLHGGFWVFRDITSSLKKKKKGWSWERVIPVSKIIAQGNDHCFGQLWILCDAGVWHTRIFECSPIEWHSASSVFRTSPSESFTKIVRKYQTQASGCLVLHILTKTRHHLGLVRSLFLYYQNEVIYIKADYLNSSKIKFL